jgi:glycosyltransferase involved in cell wall biosynthesis
LKSLRARLPVITTRIPGTADSIEDGRTGLLVSPTDDRELSVAITRLFDDAALRERLRDEGYRSLTRVSWESHVDHLISLANTL